MNVEFLILIYLFIYFRKHVITKVLFPEWNKLLLIGSYLLWGLLLLGVLNEPSRYVLDWISHLISITFIYLMLTNKVFQPYKAITYAIIPLVAIFLLDDFVKSIVPSFYEDGNSYFDAAKTFSVLWFIAFFIINNKQRKALEKEKVKAIEKEKEFKITQALNDKLEVQVAERTAELLGQKEELQQIINELKSTQSQLIQSEKMASLGELTAGIAHEIQNPLNFVNNFSEVNRELIIQLKEEIRKGNIDEVNALSDDIASNEEKITHHGKRADAIVKGMLQHSRSSSGIKEPTDINALCDEYLRLSYHGLRAKNKSFNATMNTDYDAAIGNINIIPQDIGRVILNLLTNAFYSVTERRDSMLKKQSAQVYEPTVSISTRKVGDIVEISISDNGNGIPKKILDKIFQPFFTTKPTGQGTGLGLSMSHDIIVNGHGGEIIVETEEGKGTKFIIHLPIQNIIPK